ncbi:phosphotransferase [Saccharopolyspora taberi]|uniref:Aminoglycoside phosphotransferase domain-containing protein n=1 Tax=Saccharopolyspora taberi TaxID=60895 RepID=A0ABN3VFH1_9PSEU
MIESADLLPWSGAVVVSAPGGGRRNSVVELRRGGRRLVARRSRRSPAALEWELALLRHLAGHGFRVPRVVPADDGREHVGGIVVQTWLDGREPRSQDWPAVVRELRRLHRLTADWPQRPDFAAAGDLRTTGGDVDLSVMPPEAVALCREAWARLPRGGRCVIHADACASNVRVHGGAIGFLDWDEARVDHPDLDLADLPWTPLTGARLAVARRALDAWEAAAGWRLEPDYARSRLAAL